MKIFYSEDDGYIIFNSDMTECVHVNTDNDVARAENIDWSFGQ